MQLVTSLIAVSLISSLALAQSTIADRVYGQLGSLATNEVNKGGLTADSLNGPRSVVIESAGGVYIADSFNSRVLHYPVGGTTADRVYGQISFTTTSSYTFDPYYGGPGPKAIGSARGLALDNDGGLYIADYSLNRILHFPAGSTTADRVYGQGGFYSALPNSGCGTPQTCITASSLSQPYGLAIELDGGLYVADSANHRVLHYPAGARTADRVYGQAGAFTIANNNNNGISASSLSYPFGVAVDSAGGLYIADTNNNRVLHYPPGSTTADRVYGQGGNFTSATFNIGDASPDVLSGPYSVATDSVGSLYVADLGNNRVLHFPSGSTTADRVYGQGLSFSTTAYNKGGTSASSLNAPQGGIAVEANGGLYIADTSNSRVLRYPGTTTLARISSVSESPAFINTPYRVFFEVTSSHAGIPTGTVTVSDGSGATCSGFAPAGSCWLMSTTAGTKTISISYSGDLVYNPSFGTSSLVVTAPALTTVPDLSGLTQIQVVSALTNAGLSVGIVKTSTSPNVVAGSVISQSPPPGSLVNPGSQVNIIVSGPQVINASPSSGSGAGQTFAFTFTQSGGYTKLNVVNVLINNVVDGREACYLAYVISTNTLYLVNDAGDGGGPFAGGMLMTGTGSVGNSQCTIQGSGSSAVGSGNSLTLTLSIIFSQAFAGNKILYAAARDTSNNNTGWQAAGVWRTPEPVSTGPAVAGVSPARSTAASETFTFIFIDTNGWQDIAVANVLINSAIDGRNACYVAVVPSSATTGSVYLVDDGGNAGGPYSGLSILGNATAANSQCSITAAGSSIAASSNSLTVTLAITFGENFTGNRVIYQAVRNAFLNSGWQSSGILSR